LPVKGASVYGKPVITMPKTRNQRGVYLCEVGTDTAKEILYARMKADPTPVDEATLNRPGFPGECFICELRLPDHRFRWK
ncbi:hypothetical protein, partial [Escherichia coli]|uniref:hypothetical protein n=1 Tax=Escherichia coli TaxID=562 RepID=UPI001FCE6B2C